MSEEQQEQLKNMLIANKAAFSYSMQDLPGYSGDKVTVEMVHDKPIVSKPRQYSRLEEEIREEKCKELQEAGFIEPAAKTNSYASCPTMPAKKDETGEWVERRFCVDYRLLNAATKTMRYNLEVPEKLFQKVEGKPFISSIDLRSGFHQLPLDDFAKTTTAFWWGKQLWQYTRLPYGAKNSVHEFQKVMDKVLGDAGLAACAWAYVDDVLIASSTMEEHIKDVSAVLQALHAVGLRVHPGKSVFCSDKMEYLGHVISPFGLEPQAAKVAAMASLPVPTSMQMLQSFMGLLNYYRGFVPHFSSIAVPLNKLLQKNVPFEWGPEQQHAFDTLKRQLCTEGLALRRADPNRQLILHTDWSQHGLGAVLAQLDDAGNEYMVACASRSLNVHEKNYTPWKGELLAVVWGIKTFRVYLHGVHFELCTDHRPLLWMLNQPEPTGQQARWVLALMEYDFHVRHRPGAEHINADILSRNPHLDHEDGSGAQLDAATDPFRAALPDVVYGPVGTGTPCPVPPEQIPTEMPPEQRQSRSSRPPVTEPGTSASASPAPQPAPRGRRKMSKAKFRKLHSSPYAAVAEPDLYADPIYTMNLSTIAAQGRAAYVQRYYATNNSTVLDAYVCSTTMEPWELPFSQIPDPLLSVQVQPWAEALQQRLSQRATSWVASAAATLPAPLAPTPERDPGTLITQSVANTFFPAAQAGLVVYEPFGGLCSGLEMVLRNNLPVHTYLYSDTDPAAQAVAKHRLRLLQARYPELLPPSALLHTFTAVPQDVWHITPALLQELTSRYQRQWLVVGGWECQDLSPAGTGAGLTGQKSNTLAPLMQILANLQMVQQQLPPAYIVENTSMQFNFRHPDVATRQFELICQALGQPICIDATQFDSLAHRVRNYWTNLCDPQRLEATVKRVKRTPHLRVDAVIDPDSGRIPAIVTNTEQVKDGRYPANIQGQPRSAWPTFVSYKMSRGFRPGTAGSVIDPLIGPTEPNATEREQALGYVKDDTAAPGITHDQRREVLGRCIDANVLQSIVAIAVAWHRRDVTGKPETVAAQLKGADTGPPTITAATLALTVLPTDLSSMDLMTSSLEQYLVGMAVAAVAETQEHSNTDIWKDEQALQHLREQQYQPSWSAAVRDRVKKRTANYSITLDGKLKRLFPDGSTKTVPKPETRQQLITDFHQRTGHFGVRRTGALISTQYWWWGMWGDIAAELGKCSLCSRVRASFNSEKPDLQPLPISGLMYRWGVDLCGPLPTTDRGNAYVMIAVEHYSKHLEMIPIRNKEPATTAAAFTAAVLGRYGSPAEVVTDRGGEWAKEFEHVLLDCMIDHRYTSASHPAANGLAERCVQTTKRALSKLCAAEGSQVNWDLQLPWIMLGYNASTQKATGLSPYQLLHAVTPTIPPAIRERMDTSIDLDNPDTAAADFLARAKLVQDRSIMAGDNLRIAQHRDTLRYAKLRSGCYTPQLKRYLPGDYVYVKRKDKAGLDIQAKQLILRVLEVRPTGVLILQGRCGTTRAVHLSQCAPCHLPDIDPHIDWSLGKPQAAAVCEGCGADNSPEKGRIIFCDNCNTGWHLSCHQPALASQPPGTWVCQGCYDQGITLEAVQSMQQAADQQAAQQLRPEKLSPAELKERILEGRLLRKRFTKPGAPHATQWYTGKVHYRGRQPGGNLLIVYEDGDAEITTRWQLQKDKVEWLPESATAPATMSFKSPMEAEQDITTRAATMTKPPAQTVKPSQGRAMASPATNQPANRRSARLAHKATAAAAQIVTLHDTAPSLPTGSTLTAAANSIAVGVIPVGTPTVATTDHICLVSLPIAQPQDWPRYWDLTTIAGVQSALQLLMPGPLATKDVKCIGNAIKGMLRSNTGVQGSVPGRGFVPTDPADVQMLMASINMAGCYSFYDPFAGSGTIAKEMAKSGYWVRQNDVNPCWGCPTATDALQPYSYQLPYDMIITAPPSEVLDIAVPLLAAKANTAACVHVPGHWLSKPRAARQRWLQQLASQDRLHIITGMKRGAGHRHCAWVIIAPSPLTLRSILKDNTKSTMYVTHH